MNIMLKNSETLKIVVARSARAKKKRSARAREHRAHEPADARRADLVLAELERAALDKEWQRLLELVEALARRGERTAELMIHRLELQHRTRVL